MKVIYNPELVDESLWTPNNRREYMKLTSQQHDKWISCRSIYIFDMDGTICNSAHRHHYLQSIDSEGNVVPRPSGKDWDSFFKAQKDDIVYPAIAGIMEALIANLNLIIILTGRPEDQRPESVRWLKEWSVPHHALFMRPFNNRTDDDILKPIQLHTYLTTHLPYVRTVFEDRRRIVDSLRQHGFHVCHVAEGEF